MREEKDVMAGSARMPSAMRQQTWEEMSIEDKLEKLQRDNRALSNSLSRADKILVQLLGHEHSNGRVVTMVMGPDAERQSILHVPYDPSALLP